MELYRQLGRAVAARRSQLHLTQAQVATQLNLTRASLANLENGRQRIMLHQIYRLVDALKLKSILDLIPASLSVGNAATDLKLSDSNLTTEQQASVQSLLRSVLVEDSGRKKAS